MVDERFSADAFARAGAGTSTGEELSHDLGEEIIAELREAIEPAIQRIVARLRELGHEMEDWETETSPGHRHGRSFGPSPPAPPEGWLGVYFDFSALVLFGVTETGETKSGGSAKNEMANNDDVPF